MVNTTHIRGIRGARPIPSVVTEDGDIVIEHDLQDIATPQQPQLNAIEVFDPVSGQRRVLRKGFPHQAQVLSLDTDGSWVAWIEGDSIYPDEMRWTLHAWNTRTGREINLTGFEDYGHKRGTPTGGFRVAISRGRAWFIAPDPGTRSGQGLYSIPLRGGKPRHEGSNEAEPYAVGNQLITTATRRHPLTLYTRTVEHPQRKVLLHSHSFTGLFAAADRMLTWRESSRTQALYDVTNGAPGRHVATLPANAKYIEGGTTYLTWVTGTWPMRGYAYSLRTHRAYRLSRKSMAYPIGGASDRLTFGPAQPPGTPHMTLTTIEID